MSHYHRSLVLERASDLIGKAIALRPDYVQAHNNLGNALKDRGRVTGGYGRIRS